MTLRFAEIDLDQFRGPCAPVPDLGRVHGADTDLARAFYRFAADPRLGSRFAPGGIWVGIEGGLTGQRLPPEELHELDAWTLDSNYAERVGPFSALDVLAASGGYYQLHRGVVGTCPRGNRERPPEAKGLRALTLTAPHDVVNACMDWWGVTLFVNDKREIVAVALRLGSP